jgi:hypothetical protein
VTVRTDQADIPQERRKASGRIREASRQRQGAGIGRSVLARVGASREHERLPFRPCGRKVLRRTKCSRHRVE